MTGEIFCHLGQNDWRKRIDQLKQQLRSGDPAPTLPLPEQTKAYGSELKT